MTTTEMGLSIPVAAGPTPKGKAAPFASIVDLDCGVLLRLEGEARLDNLEKLQFAIIRVSARRARVTLLDLSGLTFVSSLAIGLLVGLRKGLVRWGGRVNIVNCHPTVHETLETTGVAKLFEFYASVEDAVTAA